MIETGNPEINVDELMEKIREEVRRRKEGSEVPSRKVFFADHATTSPFNTGDNLPTIAAVGNPEPFRTKEEGYHINDFLKYHDRQFIVNAYRGTLKREPDAAGHEYFLRKLRAGKMTKAEILGRLRYAPEGRAAKVNIRGLFLNFVVQSSFGIPVLGYFFRLGTGILNLPTVIRNMQILEGSAYILGQHQQHELTTALERINQKADRDEVGRIRTDLKAAWERKADHDEVARIRTDLKAAWERKADHDEVRNLRADLVAALERKAERDEVKALRNDIQSKADNDQIREILRQTRDHKLNIIDQKRRLKLLLEEARKRLPQPLSSDQMTKMVKENDHLLDAAYVSFEDQFRGTREDIKECLKVYLPYISETAAGKEDSPIIDVGCGRGEWLEVLKQARKVARGLDINDILVEECRGLGLEVIKEEAIEYLKGLPPASVGAVTGFHIIEHLPFVLLVELLDETLRVLKPGGISIFETPNPENILVASFKYYFDPTHRNPLPPEMIRFLVESRGFCQVEILRLHPDEPTSRVKDDGSELVQRFNDYFYGPQDYAVLGYKA